MIAIAADGHRDVAAFQPVGIMAEINGLDLDLGEIDVLLRLCGKRKRNVECG